MIAQRTAMRPALAGFHFGPDVKDNVAKLIGHVLRRCRPRALISGGPAFACSRQKPFPE